MIAGAIASDLISRVIKVECEQHLARCYPFLKKHDFDHLTGRFKQPATG